MTQNKQLLLTPDGLEKLKVELEKLKTQDRPEVIERIRTAKEFGDLSENAEYDQAKTDQGIIESRIIELEELIKRAKVVVHKSGTSTIGLGSKVKVMIDGSEESYEIVGATESDPSTGRISADSPIGRALFGQKSGSEVEIMVPAGILKAKIVEVA